MYMCMYIHMLQKYLCVCLNSFMELAYEIAEADKSQMYIVVRFETQKGVDAEV